MRWSISWANAKLAQLTGQTGDEALIESMTELATERINLLKQVEDKIALDL